MSTGQVEKATKESQLIATKSHHINNGLKLFTFADDCMKEGLACMSSCFSFSLCQRNFPVIMSF